MDVEVSYPPGYLSFVNPRALKPDRCLVQTDGPNRCDVHADDTVSACGDQRKLPAPQVGSWVARTMNITSPDKAGVTYGNKHKANWENMP